MPTSSERGGASRGKLPRRPAGKRVIEVSYLGYLRFTSPLADASIEGDAEAQTSERFRLGVRTLKVFEGKRADEEPGRVETFVVAPPPKRR